MAELILLDKGLKTKLIIIGVSIAVVGIAIGSYYFYTHNLIFLKATPKNNASNVDALSPITVKFNQNIASATASDPKANNYVSITPPTNLVVITSGNTISISPIDQLTFNQKYNLTISNVVSQNGYKHANFTVSFTIGYTDWNKLPASVQQKYLDKTDSNATTEAAPRTKLINALPVDKTNYSLSYDSNSDSFDVVTKIDNTDQVKQEVNTYMAGFGIDPTLEIISYHNSTGALVE